MGDTKEKEGKKSLLTKAISLPYLGPDQTDCMLLQKVCTHIYHLKSSIQSPYSLIVSPEDFIGQKQTATSVFNCST